MHGEYLESSKGLSFLLAESIDHFQNYSQMVYTLSMDDTNEIDNNLQHNAREGKRGKGHKMTDSERAHAQYQFLKSYASNGNILLSCQFVGISRQTFYDWQEKDEQFGFRFHQAERDFADTILAEFIQRARDGYLKPVVSAGRMVYEDVPVLDEHGFQVVDEKGRPLFDRKPLMERVVSDRLLELAIKKHHPEYREKQQIDMNTTMNNNSVRDRELHDKIMEVLDEYPEAKWKIAELMNELGKIS